jgi:aminoglycoside phosphotransferase (APT) family kinase protein
MVTNSMQPAPAVGIDVGAVTRWFTTHVEAARGPLTFELIAAGRSNLTFRVSDADGNVWALRRPPVGPVLPSAHDMAREHRIISALAKHSDVPVAGPVGLCTDPRVTGATFYVMEFVDGVVARDAATAEQLPVESRQRAAEQLIEVLVRIHSLDIHAVGLGDIARRDGYIERQLRRWQRQYRSAANVAPVPLIDKMYERLLGAIPAQQGATIVHGDYRLANMVLRPDGSVAAVLDWEICTLGDPLADLGLLLVYWPDPGDAFIPLSEAPTVVDGFPRRAEIAERYALLSGRDIGDLVFYVAFGYWKLACIMQGVYDRYTAGAGGGDEQELGELGEQVARLAEMSAETAAGLSVRG